MHVIETLYSTFVHSFYAKFPFDVNIDITHEIIYIKRLILDVVIILIQKGYVCSIF